MIFCLLAKRSDFFTSNILDAVRWEYKMQQEHWAHLLNENRDSIKLHGQVGLCLLLLLGNTSFT